MMRYLMIPILLLGVAGCTTVQRGAAVGGVTGAGLGAIIAEATGGEAGEGALIGGGVGAVAGAIVGEQLEVKFCPKCGKGYTEDVRYCAISGTELQYKKR